MNSRAMRWLAVVGTCVIAACASKSNSVEGEEDESENTDDPSSSKADKAGATECSESTGSAVGIGVSNDLKSIKSLNLFEGTRSTNNEVVAPYVFARGKDIAGLITTEILAAKTEVLIQFYDIEIPSWMATQMKGALDDALEATPDLKVYLMINAATGTEDSSGAVSRISEFFGHGDNIIVAAHYDLNPTNVNHAKYIVIDGRSVIVTDTNLQFNADPIDEGGAKAKGWYQLATVVRGDIAKPLREEFLDAWVNHSTSDAENGPGPAPEVERPTTCTNMILAAKGEGDDPSYPGLQVFSSMLFYAKNEIHIITPNMNADKFMTDLQETIGRHRGTIKGQNPDFKVKAIVSYKFNEKEVQVPGFGGTNENFLKEWKEKNPEQVYRCGFEVRWYGDETGKIVGNIKGASHSKYMSADGTTMILGSYNLDEQTFNRSREVAVLIDSEEATQAFDDEFNRVWELSEPVDMGCTE